MHIDVKVSLSLLNTHLRKKNLSRSLVICGSAALILAKIARAGRQTKDVDVVGDELDSVLLDAALLVANELGMNPHWLNSGPKALAKDMKLGWEKRVFEVYSVSNLTIFSISREDMIFAKFYAYCDRQKDFDDLEDLNVTEHEINVAAEHTSKMDLNPTWPIYVEEQRVKLRKKLGYV